MRTFALQRFGLGPDTVGPAISITGTARRRDGILSLHYQVSGDIGGIAMPGGRAPGRRRHELWRHTCFECFIGSKAAAEYWEVNLAPGGDWNVYHFEGYRTGMTEAPGFGDLPSVIHAAVDEIRVETDIDLSLIVGGAQALEVGICAVLEHRHGGLSYWALRHRGTKADFHYRSGFELML